MSEFFSMGGYALYVWSSYGVAAAVLLGILLLSLRSLRGNEALLETLETATPARGGRKRRQAVHSDDDAGLIMAAATAAAMTTTGAADPACSTDGGADGGASGGGDGGC